MASVSSAPPPIGRVVWDMQVYRSGSFVSRDKYGRRLDDRGACQCLRQFFHNGYQLQTDLVALATKRMLVLRRAIELQNSFHFYSSSLLMIYEGHGATGPRRRQW